MGLDGVELVMAFEERFGIQISDAEAEHCFTPANVIDLILGKLCAAESSVCLTQHSFHNLRRVLVRQLHIPRQSIRLDTDLRSFFPMEQHARAWTTLKTGTEVWTWPELQRPAWLTWSLFGFGMALFSTCVYFGVNPRGIGEFTAAYICAGPATIIFIVTAGRLTRPFKQFIPARYATLRQLIRATATVSSGSWARNDVAEAVKAIVIEQLGLEESRYREDARFIQDLGVD
jgi:acyl carrier protein